MSRMEVGRLHEKPPEGSKCTHCGIANNDVVWFYFPRALPSDSYYTTKWLAHPEEGQCFLAMRTRIMELEHALSKAPQIPDQASA